MDVHLEDLRRRRGTDVDRSVQHGIPSLGTDPQPAWLLPSRGDTAASDFRTGACLPRPIIACGVGRDPEGRLERRLAVVPAERERFGPNIGKAVGGAMVSRTPWRAEELQGFWIGFGDENVVVGSLVIVGAVRGRPGEMPTVPRRHGKVKVASVSGETFVTLGQERPLPA